MKVKVSRELAQGRYHVSFEVTEFSPDELSKMASFGVPQIKLRWNSPAGNASAGLIYLNQIGSSLKASFNSAEDAKQYEKDVLNQIRGAAQHLRDSEDTFSSTDEVSI